MIRFSLRIVTFLIIALFLNFKLSAQVTIGLDKEAVKGALLDLKSRNSADGEVNSDKGLGMPRVALTTLSELYPMFETFPGSNIPKTEYAISKVDFDQSHIGLFVYNTTENRELCPGLYVWQGDHWLPLNEHELDTFTDIRTKADGSKEIITYPFRTFGAAGTWFLTNLRATTYADNLGVDKPSKDLVEAYNLDESATALRYYYPGALKEKTSLADDRQLLVDNPEYGLLYTYAAATNSKIINKMEGECNTNATTPLPNPIPENVEQVGVQGVCPEGWHVPSDKEWNDLVMEIANEQTGKYTLNGYKSIIWDEVWRLGSMQGYGTVHNSVCKAMISTQSVNGDTLNASSKSICFGGGMNILATGYQDRLPVDPLFGIASYMWTSSSYKLNVYAAWTRRFDANGARIFRGANYVGMQNSIRCKRNN